MPSVLAYHRPQSLDEAQKLASQKNTVLIGGGTLVIPDVLTNPMNEAVIIDLQAVEGLVGISSELTEGQNSVKVGAMTRLSEMIGNEKIPMLLHELSKKELPSTLRTQATIGGTIAERNGESILLSGFLALNAEIETDREAWTPLGQFLQPGPHQGIITAVKFDIPALDSKTSFRSVGRTPMDVPIVSGIGYAQSNGNLQISLTGVNEIPVLVNSVDDIENLDPKGDFRGSSEYRKHLASVIYSRIEEEVQA
jgi:CO/xanthine dehydrogenase FAD-binding subunit